MKKTIRFKMTALFVLFALILVLSLSVFSYLTAWDSYSEIYANDAKNAAEMAAVLLNGDSFAAYLETGETDALYDEQREMLSRIKKELDIMYLYVFAPGPDSFTYIMEAELATDDPAIISRLGDVFEYTSIEYEYLLPDVEARQASSQKVISYNEGGYGRVVSAWAPIFTSGGELAAMVEVDIALRQVEERLSSFLLMIVLLSCGIIVLLVFLLLQMMRRMIAKPLKKLTDNALNFASGGQLSSFSDILHTGDEMQTLSEAYAKMAEDIGEYTRNLAVITADRERIATELDVATRIQASMLPCIFPAFPEREEFDIYATMQPAKEVGGDFYDFFLLDEKTLAVVMADVSGKGVPAALFMVIAKTLIKNNAQYGKSPGEVFETVNNLLCENNEAEMFVTAFMGYLDIPSGKFTFVNAGHNPPLLRSGGKPDWLKTKKSFVLAGMEDMRYRQDEITLTEGDELFLYTDGVTEAMDKDYALFGAERLLNVMNGSAGLAPREVLAGVKREIDAFADGAEQADDITMLSLRYGKKAPTNELTIPAKLENMEAAQDFVSARLTGCSEKIRNKIGIVMDEILTNIVSYAYGQPGGGVTVRITVADDITIEFEDGGVPFNPLAAAEPDVTLSAEEREPGGLGIFMVQKLMDSVEYRREGEKNILVVKKKLEK